MSIFDPGAREAWNAKQTVDRMERERFAELNARPAQNPEHLLKLTRVRVLRPIFVDGQRVEVGYEVSLTAADAQSLAAIGKVELA